MRTFGYARKRVVAATALVAIWIVGITAVGPSLIRAAYDGRGPRLLTAILSGRDTVPLDAYLALWNRFATGASLALVVVVALGFAIGLARRPIRAGLERVAADSAASPANAIAVAACIGMVFGLADFLAWFLRQSITGVLHSIMANPDSVWMAPLVLAVFFVLLTAPIAALAAIVRGPVPQKLLSGALVTLGMFGFLRSLRLGLETYAVAILALGAAVALAQLMSRSGVRVFARRAALPGMLIFAVTGAGMRLGPGILERHRLSRLMSPEGDVSVLVIILDTVRSQNLSLYGYSRPTSPRIDEFARNGITFDAAFAPASWTLPSHASIFTGRQTGELNAAWNIALDATWPTLAEVLTRRGYATGGFAANLFYTTQAAGIARGFLHFEDFDLSLPTFLESTWITSGLGLRVASRLGRNSARKHAPQVTDQTLRWLAGLGGRPSFAFLNYFDAHRPYEMYDVFARKFPPGAPRTTTIDSAGVTIPIDDQTIASIDRYDSTIAFTDHYVGVLLDSLRARGLLDRTLVIITADHGEQFGEHGLYDHGNSLYTSLVQVPLVIIPPGGTPTPVRVQRPVNLASIAATVLDYTGGQAGSGIPGDPIAAIASSGAGTRPIAATADHNPWDASMVGRTDAGPMISVVVDSLHYIRNGDGTEEVYDYLADPWEAVNLIGEPAVRSVLPRIRQTALEGTSRAPRLSARTAARDRQR